MQGDVLSASPPSALFVVVFDSGKCWKLEIGATMQGGCFLDSCGIRAVMCQKRRDALSDITAIVSSHLGIRDKVLYALCPIIDYNW